MQDIDRREFNGLVLKVLAAAATGSLFGCGSKEESKPGKVSGDVEYIDDTLEIAQNNIKKGSFQDAIQVLESYSSDKKEALVSKHTLLGDAHYGWFKEECLKRNGGYTLEDVSLLKKINQGIKTNLSTAEKLDPRTQDRKWDYFLRFDGQAQKVKDFSSPIQALRSFVYAGDQKDLPTMDIILEGGPKKKFEAELNHWQNNKGSTRLIEGMKTAYKRGDYHLHYEPADRMFSKTDDILIINIQEDQVTCLNLSIKNRGLCQTQFIFQEKSQGYTFKKVTNQTRSK